MSNSIRYYKMSTFERAKRNILRDMAASSCHTAESWAHIMLKNTARLHNVEDQKKFWSFLTNPEDDEDIPMPTVAVMQDQKEDLPDAVMVETPDGDVEMEREYHRNGQGIYVYSRPKTATKKLLPLLTGLDSLSLDEDEKRAN